jgi:hypothetical protein
MRGLSAALLCVGTLGVLGCGPDNDVEADRLAKSAGDPGKADPKGLPEAKQTPATSQQEFFKRQQEQEKDMFKKGTPTKK